MKNNIAMVFDNEGAFWYCCNCSKRNIEEIIPSITEIVTCEKCKAEFKLLSKESIRTEFYVENINIEEKTIKTRRVTVWECPVCTRSNEYPYKTRLGDALKCNNCTSEVLLNEIAKEEGITTEYKFILKSRG